MLLPGLAMAVLASAGPCPAQDDPRATVEKAVKALGGAEKLGQPLATHSKIKGTIAQVGDTTFTGEFWAQGPDAKNVLHLEVGGQKITVTQVLRGDKGWLDLNGMPQELDAATLADMKTSAYHERVSNLIALLKDDQFTLKALGPSKVEGRDAVGVQVSSPGRPDVTLYFDAATALPLRSEYRSKKEALGKEVLTAVVLADYRELDPAAADEGALKAAKQGVDGPGLLAFLRSQARSDADRDRVKALIKKLSDDAFEEREKAQAELVRLGSAAVPQLREAATDDDAEVARRARACLDRIEEAKRPDGAIAAALRLVALRKPEGAAEVLLELAPSLPDEGLARELKAALAAVAVRDGKPDRAVEKALEDRDPARRAAAAAALGRDGGAFEKQPGRRVLVTGVKRPMKVTYYQDGEKQLDWEVIDVQHYNRLPESLFAPPK
jgi:hypothetical protein